MSSKLKQALKQANAKVGAVWVKPVELLEKYSNGVIITDIESAFKDNGAPEYHYFFDSKDEDGEPIKCRFSSKDVWYSRTKSLLAPYDGDTDEFFEDLKSEYKLLLFIPLPKPKGKKYYEGAFEYIDKPEDEIIDEETGEVIQPVQDGAPF